MKAHSLRASGREGADSTTPDLMGVNKEPGGVDAYLFFDEDGSI